ncbi:MAG: HK97 gp10 family phage protein [Bacillota bacterium]|nr:HK97 gp10 family phage protein [Bacillota bacterium]
MIKVDVSGFEEFEKYLNRMADGFETFLRKFLLKEALRVLRDTKRNTPVDSGYLRNSWYIGDAEVALYSREVKKKTAIKRHKKGEKKNKKWRVKPALRFSSVTLQEATINSVRKSGDNLIVDIYNPVEYASYVEYGHVSQGRVKRWIQGQFMCMMAIKDVERKMPRHFNMEFKRWLKNLERG